MNKCDAFVRNIKAFLEQLYVCTSKVKIFGVKHLYCRN